MLMRILTMRVAHEHLEDWKRYTKEIGFPGILSQPGCRKIRRMRRRGADKKRRNCENQPTNYAWIVMAHFR